MAAIPLPSNLKAELMGSREEWKRDLEVQNQVCVNPNDKTMPKRS